MSRQGKRLFNYLQRNGLEVQTDVNRSFIVLTEKLGELRTRDLMDSVLDKENFKSAVDKVVGNKGAEGMAGYLEAHPGNTMITLHAQWSGGGSPEPATLE